MFHFYVNIPAVPPPGWQGRPEDQRPLPAGLPQVHGGGQAEAK